jgi:hypothetical protein
MARPGNTQQDTLAEKRGSPFWKNQRTNPADGAEDTLEAAPASGATSTAAAPADGGAGPDSTTKQIAPDAVKRWARELNVPAPRLREAIRRVGPRVDEVRRFLASAPR